MAMGKIRNSREVLTSKMLIFLFVVVVVVFVL
jgi:hypothetical protein